MNHPITQQQYGSDQAGLICGFCFHPDGAGEEIDSAQAQAWLCAPPDGDAFLWLHFNLANAASERWLRAALPLQEDFSRPCTAAPTQPASSCWIRPCWR